KKLTTQPVAGNSPTEIQAHKGWAIKWSDKGMDYLENCVFVDDSGFDINRSSKICLFIMLPS
ncbi:hypothetical protein BDC45DRAFT_434740, partial [Circinella umbellata]